MCNAKIRYFVVTRVRTCRKAGLYNTNKCLHMLSHFISIHKAPCDLSILSTLWASVANDMVKKKIGFPHIITMIGIIVHALILGVVNWARSLVGPQPLFNMGLLRRRLGACAFLHGPTGL
jgi:hypothetical protein